MAKTADRLCFGLLYRFPEFPGCHVQIFFLCVCVKFYTM